MQMLRISRPRLCNPRMLSISHNVALLVIIHLFETFVWTVPSWGLGMIPNLRKRPTEMMFVST